MSILKAALSRENVAREHKAAVELTRQKEREAVVAAIHQAFLPEVQELDQLSLIGDYRKPIPIQDAQNSIYSKKNNQAFGCAYCTSVGLEISLGSKISPEKLLLQVWERTDSDALKAEISISRNYPYKSETIEIFHGHTEPSRMLERFFEVLGKHVVAVIPA